MWKIDSGVEVCALACLLASLVGLGSCAAPGGPGGPGGTGAMDATPAILPDERLPFSETIPASGISIEMVPVPGSLDGTIQPFYLSSTEIPWDAYDVLTFELDIDEGVEGVDGVTRPTRPYVAADRGFGHMGYPCVSISLNGAQAFCEWLTIVSGRLHRLPTEQEWEHAIKVGGTGAPAWDRSNAGESTHPIGSLPADALGLHDMSGNVAEWCTLPDGAGVMRGGSFLDDAEHTGLGGRMLPTPAWNVTDPQIPKSPWWLADGPFAGFRVLCETE